MHLPVKALYSLPIVSPPGEPFAADALNQCAAGSCSNCGLCCVTMENTVPSKRGDVESVPMRKAAGQMCPQLVRNARGQYMCALYKHVQGGDPRLADCADWTGGGNGILQLTVQTERTVEKPYDARTAEMIADLTRQQLLAGFRREVSQTEAVSVARHYLLQLGQCPVHVFDLLGIGAMFRQMFSGQTPSYFRLDRELWVASPDLYHQFFEGYVWNGRGPYARAVERFERSGP